jgi:hypothetical protein
VASAQQARQLTRQATSSTLSAGAVAGAQTRSLVRQGTVRMSKTLEMSEERGAVAIQARSTYYEYGSVLQIGSPLLREVSCVTSHSPCWGREEVTSPVPLQVMFRYNQKKKMKKPEPAAPTHLVGSTPASGNASPTSTAPKARRSGWGFCCGGRTVEIVEPTAADDKPWAAQLDTTLLVL